MLKNFMIYLILFSSLVINEKVEGGMIGKVRKSKSIKNQQILDLIKQYKKIDDEIGLEFNEYIELANNEEISDDEFIKYSENLDATFYDYILAYENIRYYEDYTLVEQEIFIKNMNKARKIYKEKIMKMVEEEVIPTRQLLLNSYIEGMDEVIKTF